MSSELECFTVTGEDQLAPVVDSLLRWIDRGYRLVLLYGDLGAGKTTLVKHLSAALDIDDPVSSPTFSLVQVYASGRIGHVVHIDLYRLEKPGDLDQIGLEEYLDSGSLCLIEWPAIGIDRYDTPYVIVEIRAGRDNLRTFSISTHDQVDA